MYAIINDKLEKSAKISVYDRGFLLGDGIFETLRVYNGKILFFDEHYKRFCNSAKLIKLDYKFSKLKLLDNVNKLIIKNKLVNAKIRITVTRGESKLGLAFGKVKPNIIILSEEVKLLDSCNIVTFNSFREYPEIKSLSYLKNVMAKLHAQENNAFESIFVHEGYIGEGSFSNIFIVKNGVVITPEKNILHGITRDIVIKLCNSIKLVQRRVKLKELLDADEVFITFSSCGVVPVYKVNNKFKRQNTLSQKIKSLYEDYIDNV